MAYFRRVVAVSFFLLFPLFAAAAPTITSLTPNSGAVGSAIVIAGSGFGTVQSNVTVKFNSNKTATITSFSSTSITATVPSGATTGNVVVTVSGVASNGVTFTVTAAPSITSLTPSSGAVGSAIVIAGSNFGSSQGTGNVKFNGTTATINSWSSSSITATVPTGATTGTVVVRASGGVASNGVTFTVTAAPSITTLTPTSGAVGASVVIAGTTFGSTQGNGNVKFNGTTATINSWSATSITATVPSGATSGNVVVTAAGGVASNGVAFTVVPVITSLSPNTGPVNSQVTITGTSFGVTQGTSIVNFHGQRGFGNPVAAVVSWSDTSIVVLVPNNAITGVVTATIGSQVTNGVNFTIVAPTLTSLAPTSGAAGTAVTLTGTNFGSVQGTSTATFNGGTATVLSWSNTSIAAVVPAGATSGNVFVSGGTNGGDTSNGVNFTVPLALYSVSPSSGLPGTAVTLFGSSFGVSQGTSTVLFNGVAATATSWSDTAIGTAIPAGATSGAVVVMVGGLLSNGVAFTVPPPTITSTTNIQGAVGTNITISGSNFGTSQGTSTVSFNGTQAVPTSWSNTSINVPVPVGASAGNLVVTVGGQASNGVSFTPGPSIQSLSLTSASVGTPVTINGASFGATQSGSSVKWNGTTATPTSWSDSSIVILVPNVSPGSGNIVVTAGFSSNSSPLTVVANAAISPSSGSTGTTVTITGSGFGATQGSSTVTFNGTPATPSSWSNTSITSPVPNGLQPGATIVVVTVGSVGSSVSFTVNPAIASLTPAVGVIGTSVTITGKSFGSTQGASTVQFNGTTATPTSWSNTSITAPVPTGALSGNVVVTAAGQPSNGVFFNFGPVIQTVSPNAGPAGTPLTISGINFGATQGTSIVQINGIGGLTPTSWSDTSITATAPAAVGTGNILVIARGLNSNTTVSFTVVPNIIASPNAAPLAAPITISGTNFGSTQGSSTVTFNGIVSTPTAWSNTSITAPVPNGVAAGTGTVTVTVGGVPNSTSFTVVPAIASVSPTSGLIGTSVTVTGSSFGATQGASVVAFGQKLGAPTSWSDTSITVPVPTGASTGNVTVSSGNGYTSNGVSFTVLTPPTISSIDNSSLPVGGLLGITGTHFGATQGSSTVTFNGTPATPSSWSDTQLGVTVPIGATTGNVVVTVNGLASNGVAFTPGPSITALSSNWAPIGLGPVPATITVSGADFGATQGSSTLFWNGLTMTPSSWSNSSIAFPVTVLSTGTGNVVVVVNGKTSNGVALTIVPAITTSPSSGPLGTSFTISGTDFGATQGSSTVTLGGVAATPSAWSNTSITTIVPNGVPAGNQNLLVTIGSVVNSVVFGVTPAIKSLSPTSGVIGTSVTISGTSFGATQGASTVAFGSKTATPTSWSDTQIVAPVPAGTTTGSVVVTAGLPSNGLTFTVSGAPVINTLEPGEGVIGTVVTLSGANFGATQGASTVTFNGTAATPTSWSNTSITVAVPSGATSGNIVVTVASAPSNPVGFIVSSTGPNIQSVSPSAAPLGTAITITGTGFGATQGTSVVKWNGFTMVPTSWSNTSITFTAPNASNGPGFLAVTVNGVTSNGVAFTVLPNISLSPLQGPVGTTVTISGTSFGATQGTSTVTFNGTAVTPTSWSNTSIVASVPAAMPAGNIKVVVTVGGVPNTGSFVVTPAIISLSPNSGPTGTSLTITGTSFGATRGTSTVDFDSIVATPTSWSDSSITVPVPVNVGIGNVNVVVSVGDRPSNAAIFTVTFGITGIAPNSGPVGTSVTITGTNLGSTQGTSTVKFNGVAATPTSWSTTQIVVPVPAAATSGPVVVTIGGVSSPGITFTVTPVITSVSPTSGAVGASVTIAGSGFGTTQGTSTVTFNGSAATPTSWSSTSIVVPIPAAATSGPLVVTVGGVPSSGIPYTVTPVISSVSPTSGAVGSSVTITGSGFGAAQGTSTVTFNGVAATPTSWSSTSIAVPVPSGATSGNVVVTVNGVASNGVSFTVRPAITSLSPASGPVGTSVTITGTSFGSSQGTSTVAFNGTAATPTSWSDTQIVVPVPSAATTGNVVVTVNGVATNGASFTVAPAITSVSPASGPAGASITITGTTFGATQGTSTVTFNGAAATPTSWSNTQIVVPVPSAATTGNIVVTVNGTASNGVSFTVTPGITSLSVTSGAAGTPVTITGTNFGTTQGTSTVAFSGTLATPTSWSNTSIVVPVPNGAHTGNVVVTVNGQASNGVNFTVTGVPSITGISPASGAVGSTVNIAGTGFGASQGASTVFFNGTLATSITSWSATAISAVVPTGATSGLVTVVVGSIGSNSLFFVVPTPPVITTLSLPSGPVGMGFVINGTNFGGVQGAGSTVSLNNQPLTVVPFGWSSTAITVQVPLGATTGFVVVTTPAGSAQGPEFVVVPAITCPF
jgi:hypothetical protein